MTLRNFLGLLLSATLFCCWVMTQWPSRLAADDTRPVDFNREVLPILSDNCFTCHGPDGEKRIANLRLDTKEGLFADRGGYWAIVPGKSAQSKLYQKINASDEMVRMPPSYSGRKLTQSQVALIKRWIDEGAVYNQHWAFVAPARPPVPEVKYSSWTRNPIDNFVLARLEAEGLQPSSEADSASLLRRVSFDLTGSPPTPAEVRAFVADKAPNSYERQVDRLLASPHYGENMARMWLDLARYADSHGFDVDDLRGMWPWRDWVIDAYNHNLPFDQFTVKQLAGDLLPDGTVADKVATGFNRNNSMGLTEFGERLPVGDEDRATYVADRVSTTGTTWLGLTVGCARCHDHKYDPIKQKDFYRLAAYFNSVPEFTAADRNGNAEPVLALPSPRQQGRIDALEARILAALALIPEKDMVNQENQWRTTALASIPPPPQDGLTAYYEFEGTLNDGSGNGHDGHAEREQVAYLHGAAGKAAVFNGVTVVDFGNIAAFDRNSPGAISLWTNPKRAEKQNLLQKRDASANWKGFEISLDDPVKKDRSMRIVARLASRWPDDAIEIKSKERVLTSTYQFIRNMGTPGRHIVLNYDGSGKAAGLKLYLDGTLIETETSKDHLTEGFKTSASMSIGDSRLGQPFAGQVDELRVYNRQLSSGDIDNLQTHVPARGLLLALQDEPTKEIRVLREPQHPDDDFTDDEPTAEVIEGVWRKQQQARLADYFLSRSASPSSQQAYLLLQELRREKAEVEESVPTTMVMAEMDHPMDTFVLGRGQFYNKMEKVAPGVPSFLPQQSKDAPANRLALARWLVDPGNPLTARVEVNRYWQHFFGIGIVKSVDDFGSQGDRPTHPELLDWLATEFVRTGWDIKAMQRLIVLSATYRQSSRLSPQLRERDPENRLFARGPRVRLAAEEIRDNALAISGLLDRKIGGPSVYPYQPAGLWGDASGESIPYKQGSSTDLYRRSVYTVWRRSVPAPSFAALDAPSREICVARRNLTNTPLQALVLMDDPTYVEASRLLAQRALLEGGKDLATRLDYLFLWAIERKPTATERDLLLKEAQQMLAVFQQDREAARKLLNVGETKPGPRFDPAELAAWTTVTRTILNMDETITKQ